VRTSDFFKKLMKLFRRKPKMDGDWLTLSRDEKVDFGWRLPDLVKTGEVRIYSDKYKGWLIIGITFKKGKK
jgi:hypothetical protein